MFIGFFSVNCALHLVASQAPQRIHSEISDAERFILAGNIRSNLTSAQDQGEVSGSLVLPQMTMHFNKSASQQADLAQLLQLQQNRHSIQFHKWLTPEDYADRFGMNEKDLAKVTAWLESQGFSNVQASRGRTFVTFSGTAARAQAAFNTSIHRYLTTDGVKHYANATEPQLPKGLNGVVESIRGLHDFHPKPHARFHFTSSVSGNHFLTPDDFATIYDVKALYNSGIDGTGRTIAIPGQSDLVISDIETFQTNAGLPIKDPKLILAGSVDPGISIDDLGESDLDIEWAGGVAKGATIIYVYSTDVVTSESYAVDNNVADVLAITYGECEASDVATANSLNSLFQQASAQGMSVVAASGDQGPADCDDGTSAVATQGLAVDVPASLPYVTGVGGTEFNEGNTTFGTAYWSATNDSGNGSAISYIPEIAWNDSAADSALAASGGGASSIFNKPTFQTGTGVPADGKRDVPDLSFSASADHDGYLTCTETGTSTAYSPTCVVGFRLTANGNLNVTGGTSASSPTFAAVIAMLDQKFGARQGWLNPNIYTLASISSTAFHDITSGNNIVPCRGGSANCSSTTVGVQGTIGYSATTGYDQVTGLGSLDVNNFVNQWLDDFVITPSVTTLTVNPGSSGTANIAVNPFGSFTGNVTFTCAVSSAITATTCSIPGTVSAGSGSVVLTVTAGSTAKTPWWHRLRGIPPAANQPGILFLLSALILALGVYLMTKQRSFQIVGFAFTVLLVVGLSSCGGSSNSTTVTTSGGSTSTPSETGNITVTGTSGSLVNTTIITLTIP